MKNKGFTLIELIAIIVLIGSIFLVIYKEINDPLEKSYEGLNNAQKSNIKAAAKDWTVDNLKKLPENDNQSCNISLTTLQNEGYIDDEIISPKTSEKMKAYVKITKKQDNYIYKVIEKEETTTCK